MWLGPPAQLLGDPSDPLCRPVDGIVLATVRTFDIGEAGDSTKVGRELDLRLARGHHVTTAAAERNVAGRPSRRLWISSMWGPVASPPASHRLGRYAMTTITSTAVVV